MDQLMNGSNPKADAELAAAIGCKITDEIPPVAIGPAGFEVDASGRPVEMPCPSPMFESRVRNDARFAEFDYKEKAAFMYGLIHASFCVNTANNHTKRPAEVINEESTRYQAMK